MKQLQFRMDFISRRARYLGIIWLVLLLGGCTPATVPDAGKPDEMSDASSADPTPGGAVAKAPLPSAPQVTISVNASSLPADRLEAFQEHGGAESLIKSVSKEIAKMGKQFGAKPTQMQITVTNFRLRSTAAGLWLGMMAGADILDVQVTVVADGQTKKTFDTGVGGAVAGLIKPTAEGRFEGLVAVLSERIVQGL